jgi:hypothetical protein
MPKYEGEVSAGWVQVDFRVDIIRHSGEELSRFPGYEGQALVTLSRKEEPYNSIRFMADIHGWEEEGIRGSNFHIPEEKIPIFGREFALFDITIIHD